MSRSGAGPSSDTPAGDASGAQRTVRVSVNGREHEVAASTRLVDFLRAQGVDPQRIAVERNRKVVPRAEHAEVVMADGDAYEVVQFVGGG